MLSGFVNQKPDGPPFDSVPSCSCSSLFGAGERTISARLPSNTLRRSTASSRKNAWPLMSWQMLFCTATPLVACSTTQRLAEFQIALLRTMWPVASPMKAPVVA